MFAAELALIGNALMLLLAMALQFDGSDDDDVSNIADDEDFTPSLELLFNAGDYGEAVQGTDDDDAIFSDQSNSGTFYDLLGGDDRIEGTENADFANGGDGDDFLALFPGNDIALGGAGDDQIFAGRGNDIVDGGSGDDRIDGSLDDDVLYGNAGNDTITGGKGSDFVSGGAGDDVISGSRLDSFGSETDGIDTLEGGSGDDTLRLSGADTGTGGSGNDLFVVFDSLEPDNVVTITDYDADSDMIELHHSEGDDAPEISVVFDPETNIAVVALDGQSVLEVAGASELSASQINLVAEV